MRDYRDVEHCSSHAECPMMTYCSCQSQKEAAQPLCLAGLAPEGIKILVKGRLTISTRLKACKKFCRTAAVYSCVMPWKKMVSALVKFIIWLEKEITLRKIPGLCQKLQAAEALRKCLQPHSRMGFIWMKVFSPIPAYSVSRSYLSL